MENQTSDDPQLDPQADPEIDPATDVAPVEVAPDRRKGYAVFNQTLARFHGGVRDSRKDASEVAKALKADGYDAEIREV